MNTKMRIFLKMVLVTSLLAVSVFAATPGSACTVRARIIPLLSVTLSGRVSANGQNCVPLGVPDILTPLRTGVVCNAPEEIILNIRARAICPN
jgi:hypothetical protein